MIESAPFTDTKQNRVVGRTDANLTAVDIRKAPNAGVQTLPLDFGLDRLPPFYCAYFTFFKNRVKFNTIEEIKERVKEES